MYSHFHSDHKNCHSKFIEILIIFKNSLKLKYEKLTKNNLMKLDK